MNRLGVCNARLVDRSQAEYRCEYCDELYRLDGI